MTNMTRIAAPAVTPVSLDEAKAHLRVSSNDTDNLINMYIQAATDYVDGEEGFLGRALVTQSWRLTLDAFPENGQIKIPLPPLQSVTSVEYDDASGNSQTVDPGNYFVDTASEPGWVVSESGSPWPATIDAINAVRVNFVAGYLPDASSPPNLAANVPFSIKAGILLMVGSFFEMRESMVEERRIELLPFGAENLFRRYRMQIAMA